MAAVPDPIFANPRLAEIYDPLDPDRSDLVPYLAMAEEFEAHSVLDLGCGTGTLACLLAAKGLEVVGVDPAEASLRVARRKAGADRVHWHLGDATTLPPVEVDLALMTGNVAQVFLDDSDWGTALSCIRGALHPSGRVVFEMRDPARRGWEEWNRKDSFSRVEIPGAGIVESWVEVTDVSLPRVTFRWTYRFENDGAILTSDSTLRFREREEVEASLSEAGFAVLDVRGAPDRPGREFVFVAGSNG